MGKKVNVKETKLIYSVLSIYILECDTIVFFMEMEVTPKEHFQTQYYQRKDDILTVQKICSLFKMY